MILNTLCAVIAIRSCPHTRGDDKSSFNSLQIFLILSPYAWGWSYEEEDIKLWDKLVPIRVGMILSVKISPQMAVSCPHTRGDDPYMSLRLSGTIYLSPYAWGWSYADYIHNKYTRLVPIRVGMILSMKNALFENGTCPHTRGDDPITAKEHHVIESLSPYAWGWSFLIC